MAPNLPPPTGSVVIAAALNVLQIGKNSVSTIVLLAG